MVLVGIEGMSQLALARRLFALPLMSAETSGLSDPKVYRMVLVG